MSERPKQRKASPGYTYEACHGCGHGLSQREKGHVCPTCHAALTLGHVRSAEIDMLKAELAAAETRSGVENVVAQTRRQADVEIAALRAVLREFVEAEAVAMSPLWNEAALERLQRARQAAVAAVREKEKASR